MRNRVIWIFIGNESAGSSRIHGFNIHNKLSELGYNSYILFSPPNWHDQYVLSGLEDALAKEVTANDILIIQKVKTIDYVKLFTKLKERKCKIVFLDSDLPIAVQYLNFVDLIICPSKYLMDLYQRSGFQNVEYIEDSPEHYAYNQEKVFSKKCVWFGQSSGDKWNSVLYIQEIFRKYNIDWNLTTISNTTKADILWDDNSFMSIASYDAVVIPIINRQSEATRVKSANRVLQSMALGVPVICHPIPAYTSLIENTRNGFIVDSDFDWKRALDELTDEGVRSQVRDAGYGLSLEYHIDKLILTWIDLLSLEKSQTKNNVGLDTVKCSIYKSLRFKNVFYYAKYISLEEDVMRKWICLAQNTLYSYYKKIRYKIRHAF